MSRTIRKISRNSSSNSNKTARFREMIAAARGRVPAPVNDHPSREQKNPRRCVLNRSCDRTVKMTDKIMYPDEDEDDGAPRCAHCMYPHWLSRSVRILFQ